MDRFAKKDLTLHPNFRSCGNGHQQVTQFGEESLSRHQGTPNATLQYHSRKALPIRYRYQFDNEWAELVQEHPDVLYFMMTEESSRSFINRIYQSVSDQTNFPKSEYQSAKHWLDDIFDKSLRKAIFGTWSPEELAEPSMTNPAPNNPSDVDFERLRHLLDAIPYPVKEVVPLQGTIDPKLLCAEHTNDFDRVQPFQDALNESPAPSGTLEPESSKEQVWPEEHNEVLSEKDQTLEDDQVDIKENTVQKEQKTKKADPWAYELEEYRRNFANLAYHKRGVRTVTFHPPKPKGIWA
ncbi:hypothetical protein BDZ89DRAFT_1050373 [Hymenopellis radicata]|nr:hypothetical protein BDZ89DRAFT_1050373 [Hymenopellis radicata]